MPLIDSFMRELNTTGYISKQGRFIVSNYFTICLKQDWRYGAYYFEEKLIDHNKMMNYALWSDLLGDKPKE